MHTYIYIKGDAYIYIHIDMHIDSVRFRKQLTALDGVQYYQVRT